MNMSQSSNDTFPTAMHIAAVETLHNKLYGPLNHLIEIFEEKVKSTCILSKSDVPICRMLSLSLSGRKSPHGK